MNLVLGQWIRYHTTSIRGPGETTHIGKITRISLLDGKQHIFRAGYAEVHRWDVISTLEIDEDKRMILRETEYHAE